MKLNVNEKFPIAIKETGTIMDFIDGTFVFVIKDDAWTTYEINACKKHNITIEFVCKYDITLFLITVQDAIDTSDFIFNIHEQEQPQALMIDDCFHASIYLIDQENIVCATRHVTLSKVGSALIVEQLQAIYQKDYSEAEFNCNLEGIQATWEPFELQEFALMSESF